MLVTFLGTDQFRNEAIVRKLVRSLHKQGNGNVAIVTTGAAGPESWAGQEARKLSLAHALKGNRQEAVLAGDRIFIARADDREHSELILAARKSGKGVVALYQDGKMEKLKPVQEGNEFDPSAIEDLFVDPTTLEPEKNPKIPAKLLEIRQRQDLGFKPNSYMKTTFTDFDGQEHPLTIRYYQVQGILHMVYLKRFVLGDDCGLGKSIQAIGTLTYLWEMDPSLKAVILTTKSAVSQWAGEFAKFTTGIKTITCLGTKQKRKKARDEFVAHQGPVVLVMGYRSAVQDFTYMQHWSGYVLIGDEITAVKNPRTQVHQVVRHLASAADRVYGLTATIIKNNLMEGYGIFQVVAPDLFPQSYNNFMLDYCQVRMQKLPKSNRQIPVIIGYSPMQIRRFKYHIAPFFYGRAKHEVAKELPTLTRRLIGIPMNHEQLVKYKEALDGLLETGAKTGKLELKETTELTSIIYCQQIANHPALVDCAGASEKLRVLIDLLKDGELDGEKVIVFSRFRKFVDIVMRELAKKKIQAVRVTGSEEGEEREAAKKKFQDPNDPTRVCCITMAGGDAINLQAAKAIVFLDTPWSAGDFIQIIGRMIRIGSTHDRCYAIHLVSKFPKSKKPTIDDRVQQVLNKKMNLIEAVLGKRIKGDAGQTLDAGSDTKKLFKLLVEDAKK